ncbi:MAG: T9SS type A sorting domain-containing protein [Rhodothermaceae bacterium]
MKLNILAILIFLFELCYAQEELPMEYFPHSVGDYWEYTTYHNLDVVYKTFIIGKTEKDSLGNTFIYYSDNSKPTYMIDTENVVSYLSIHPITGKIQDKIYYYKLDSIEKEEWWFDKKYNQKARIDSLYEGYFLGKLTTFKIIGYYQLTSTIDTMIDKTSWYLYSKVLAKGFGHVSDFGADSPPYYLSGCIISGDTTGSIMVSVEEIEGSIPEGYGLYQNYPNPFNPSTTIEFEINEGKEVRLEIYNMLGRKIKTLLEGYRPAGRYKVKFNISDQGLSLGSGVYIYRLKAGQYNAVKKMVFLK